jgi:hypothetical protein
MVFESVVFLANLVATFTGGLPEYYGTRLEYCPV